MERRYSRPGPIEEPLFLQPIGHFEVGHGLLVVVAESKVEGPSGRLFGRFGLALPGQRLGQGIEHLARIRGEEFGQFDRRLADGFPGLLFD